MTEGIDTRLLKAKMAYHGFNIGSLADEAGISRDTVTNVIKGNNLPSYPVINALFYTLKLTPEEGIAIFFNSDLRITKEKEEKE